VAFLLLKFIRVIMHITLAPMEGVLDHLMRDMLTQIGGYDLCVTEFIRIVDAKLPERVFYRFCPELHQGGFTPSGTPVKIQLLGNHPQYLAENAQLAVELGSHGIDINFGCPAKTVNKSRGGAVLLQYPEELYAIINAVREAVPSSIAVTAKMRLGFADTELAIENADAIYQAGATELAIHARTKSDGYRPPAYWPWIAKIKQHVPIPIIANGEIWSAADAQLCQSQSTCDNLMLGRGAIALPNLANCIKHNAQPMPWAEMLALLIRYSAYEIEGVKGCYYPNRIKQWFTYLKRQYPQAQDMFTQIRRLNNADEIVKTLAQ
jgi:tRNA-dihydrouridine synthase C